MDGLIGQRLGNYQVLSLVGSGGMAKVYRARQITVDREVAIKVISSNVGLSPEYVARFEREARTIANLNHPHILKLFDYGREGDLIYLVMELQAGGNLQQRIAATGPLSSEQTAIWLSQIADALDYAHEQGVVHRDMKPQNVLLDLRSNAILSDFGIARFMQDSSQLTGTGIAMGTPNYMAPELWSGTGVTYLVDIYALGIMAYEMLTGRTPFNGETPFRLMFMHLNDTLPPIRQVRPDLPAAVEKVLIQATAKDPSQRFQRAGAFADTFKLSLSGITPPGINIQAVESRIAASPPSKPIPTPTLPPSTMMVSIPPTMPPTMPPATTLPPTAPPTIPPAPSRRIIPLVVLVIPLLLILGAALGVAFAMITNRPPSPPTTTATVAVALAPTLTSSEAGVVQATATTQNPTNTPLPEPSLAPATAAVVPTVVPTTQQPTAAPALPTVEATVPTESPATLPAVATSLPTQDTPAAKPSDSPTTIAPALPGVLPAATPDAASTVRATGGPEAAASPVTAIATAVTNTEPPPAPATEPASRTPTASPSVTAASTASSTANQPPVAPTRDAAAQDTATALASVNAIIITATLNTTPESAATNTTGPTTEPTQPPSLTPTLTPAPTETFTPIPATATLTATLTDTPSATPTYTPSPTITPSDTTTPTPTNTPVPTATFTKPPTETPTALPTDTPKPTSTPIPSATPTATPTPMLPFLGVTIQADFEHAKFYPNWNDGWAPVVENGRTLYCQSNTTGYHQVNFGNANAGNYSVEIRIRIVSAKAGHAAILTRLDTKGIGYRHALDFTKPGDSFVSQYFYGGDQSPNPVDLGFIRTPIRSGDWNTLRAEVDDKQIRTFFNGKPFGNKTATQRAVGTAGLESGPDSTVCIDRLIVRTLDRTPDALAVASKASVTAYATIQFEPAKGSAVIGAVNKGETVFVLDQSADGSMTLVRQDKTAIQGWVSADSLNLGSAATATPNP